MNRLPYVAIVVGWAIWNFGLGWEALVMGLVGYGVARVLVI